MTGNNRHQQVWRIAGPMILSNLTVPLLGMVDTAVVGHLDEPYHMGAVAIGAMIFGIVFWGFGFLRMGTTGITAQSLGRTDNGEIRATLARAVALALLFSVLLLLLQRPIGSLAFYLVEGSNLVEEHGRLYFDIRIYSAPATLVNYVLLGWFLGLQNARAPLFIMFVVNAINMVLDVFFVMVSGLGADGVAWASLIAEYCGVLLAVFLVISELKRHPGEVRKEHFWQRDKLRNLISVNRDIFIRNLCLMFSLAFFTAQSSRFGELVLAANAVLFHFQTFMAYGLDGFAHAAEALVGKAVGARNRQAYFDAIRTCTLWALFASIGFAVIYILLGDLIIDALTDINAVRETAYHYLPWVALLPLVSVWSFLFDGIYIGATRAMEMRNTMLFSAFFIYLPVWYLLLPLNNHGLWLAFVCFIAARAISMAVMFKPISRRAGIPV